MAQFNGTVEQLEQSVNTTENMADYVVESEKITTTDGENEKLVWNVQKWYSGRVVCICRGTAATEIDPGSVYSKKITLPVVMNDTNYYIFISPTLRTPTADLALNPYYEKTKNYFFLGATTAQVGFECMIIGEADV